MQAAADVLSVPFGNRPMTVLQLVPPDVTSSDPLVTPDVTSQTHFLASQVGEALGYVEKSFQNRLNEWSAHLRPDKDLITLDGDDLAALKDAGAVGLRARSVLLLSESGLYRVLMLSRKKAALRLQEWLADEVLPAIRRTGSYTARPFKAALDALPDESFAAPARPVLELLNAEAALGRPLPLLRGALAARKRSSPKGPPPDAREAHRAVWEHLTQHEDPDWRRGWKGREDVIAIRSGRLPGLLRQLQVRGSASDFAGAWLRLGLVVPNDGERNRTRKVALGRYRSFRCLLLVQPR